MLKSFDIIKAIFLLILAISGNFVAETLGCKTQLLLSNNMIIKQLIVLFMIYFTLSHISETDIHPLTNIKFSIIIWVLFLLFTKMNLQFTILSFVLLLINYIIHTYIEYYQEQEDNDDNKDIINKLQLVYDTIYKTLIVIIITGFILYFKSEYKDYKLEWSTKKFLFGVNKCKSMN